MDEGIIVIELLLGAIPVALAFMWREGFTAGRRSGQMRKIGLPEGKALIIDEKALGEIRLGLGKLEISAKKSSEQMDEFARTFQYTPSDPMAGFKITGVVA